MDKLPDTRTLINECNSFLTEAVNMNHVENIVRILGKGAAEKAMDNLSNFMWYGYSLKGNKLAVSINTSIGKEGGDGKLRTLPKAIVKYSDADAYNEFIKLHNDLKRVPDYRRDAEETKPDFKKRKALKHYLWSMAIYKLALLNADASPELLKRDNVTKSLKTVQRYFK